MNEKAYIQIESKGFRHLIEDEWRAIKGIHSLDQASLASCATSIESNIFSCLGVYLHPLLCFTTNPSPYPPSIPTLFCAKCGYWTNHSTEDHRDADTSLHHGINKIGATINWSPQDLSPQSTFYRNTMQNLYAAVATLPPLDQQPVFLEALETLSCHRLNYSGDYIHRLVVLWWEWPRRHWKALREGTSMNFLRVPTPGFIANQEMDATQLALAVDFVEELIRLRVLKRASDHGVTVKNNFPLFLVPKPGQPGQYRCIADGKRGGQNDCCVPDPCIMTSPEQILPSLYTGGWSVVLDMSKYFHTFPNKAEERQFFGLLFPGTNEPYFYDRFPMGTCNSPGRSGRLGASFIRIILAKSPLFQGVPVDNSKVAMILGRKFDPSKGEGRILIGADGLPAALLWINVDDILLHAPTRDKVEAAMQVVLDEMVRLGLICQHVKTNPPAQEVKYCGFLYNTVSLPTMLVPDDKLSRGLALVRFLQRGVFRQLARLTLSKVIGFLTSLVPATPSNIGASFLHSLNGDLHSLQDASLQGTRSYYFTVVDLSPDSHIELYWWEQVLCQRLICRQAQKMDMASLGVTWGDGSGTGTGGTFNWISIPVPNTCQPLETWLGVWDFMVLHFSSNWKELRTLLLTLQRLKKNGTNVRNRVLWYLTDNQVTYDICRKSASSSRELFKLIRDIRLLELELGCKLEVIHVPGKLMITQGTDGLSRGAILHQLGSQAGILSLEHLFTPAEPSMAVLHWAFDIAQLSHRARVAPWQFRTDLDDWSHEALLDTNTVWMVSPHLGHQCMVRAMQAWVESPWNSSHLFILPRVMQRNFGRVSKFIKISGEGWDIPLSFTPVVPFVVYYLPPYCRLTTFLHKRWTSLPQPLPPFGSNNRSKICKGCNRSTAGSKHVHKCLFKTSGFSINNRAFRPCQVEYHAECIRVDAPFVSRLPNGRGLQYPPLLAGLPFICELCTVRANIGRELEPIPNDLALLALERMRMIDLTHFWSHRTITKNIQGIRQYLQFHRSFGLPLLPTHMAQHPPVDHSIRLFWCMEHKSLQPSRRSRSGRVTFNSLRSIRSAVSAFSVLSKSLLEPSTVYRDKYRRVLGASFISPTDNIASTMTAQGFASRLGTTTRPSKVLHACHIHWNQRYRISVLADTASLSLEQKYVIIAGQCAKLCGWLGWLRSGECFTIMREDVRLLAPENSATFGLPPNMGGVLLSLLPETKSSRTLTADVVIAWATSSGLYVGRWFRALLIIMDRLGLTQPTSLLFQDPWTGQPWTSTSYRHHILFPLLRLQCDAGDAYLRRFDGSPGNTLADNFTMFHLYRRGGRSHCRRHRPGCVRAATSLEVYLHGRWSFNNTGREAVDLHYIEPTLEDRFYLTLLAF